jgi:HTH-type transcriptional regulator/antitoxin HigA
MKHQVLVSPILSDADLEDALIRAQEIEKAPLDSPEGQEFLVLSTLIESYERQQVPLRRDPIALIKGLMDGNDLTQKDLPEIGSQGVVSEVLSGKRQITPRMAAALGKRFHIPPENYL